MARTNLQGFTLEELEQFILSIGEKKFRARQLFHWLYSKEASSFEEMTTLSQQLRSRLTSTASIELPTLAAAETSKTDGTTKLLFELSDGSRIESVLIPPRAAFENPDPDQVDERQRLTLCISTQSGCPLDCAFCATGTMGLARNLTAGEIVGQVLKARQVASQPITNLVYMGMGEPLMNYDAVMKSVDIIVQGLNIAARRITVSTAGWASNIRRMADEQRKVKLAVSLHSLDQHFRQQIMPISRKFPLDELLSAMEYYYRTTRRRPTIEYIPFDGRTDREEDIRQLVRLARRIPCKINLIPFHSIAFVNPGGIGASLQPTPRERIEAFAQELRRQHCTVFVRSSAGDDIAAACGQLAVQTPIPRLRAREKTHPTVSHIRSRTA